MRKFLINQFVLDYWIRIGKKTFNAPRASRWIYSLMIIAGLTWTEILPVPGFIQCILMGGLVASLYLGFLHFKFFPVKWGELDELQKLQYGVLNNTKLSPLQLKELAKLKKKLS